MNGTSIRGLLACASLFFLSLAPLARAQVVVNFQRDQMLDTADATTGWAGHNPITADTTIKVHGTGSLKSEGSGKDRFRKTFSNTLDVSRMRYLTFWYYVSDPKALGSGTDHGQIELTSSGTFDNQEQNWSVRDLHLQRGWNYVVLDLPGRPRSGTPIDLTRVNFLRIYHQPTTALTTRIDHIKFTNREPGSIPYTAYLDLKRSSRSTDAVEQLDAVHNFLITTPSSTLRNKACRRLSIDLTHREISGGSLRKIGVEPTVVDNEILEKRFLKEYMCGQRTWTHAELVTHLQSRATTEIAVVAQIASLFDFSMEAAAETKDSILAMDLARITRQCGANPAELGAYMETGALPPGSFPGLNLLVKNCTGGVENILVQLGNIEPVILNRRTAYSNCMAAFSSQGSECDNPYASPDGDYKERIKQVPMPDSHKKIITDRMTETLREIREITLQDARDYSGETHPRSDAPAALRAELETLHQDLDRHRSQAQLSDMYEMDAHLTGQNPPVSDTGNGSWPDGPRPTYWDAWYWAYEANAQRFHDEKIENLKNVLEDLRKICSRDPQDPSCRLADDEWIPTPEEVVVEAGAGSKRCASMNVGGQSVWYDKPAGDGLFRGQINEADRIDHCVCKLFERSYGETLPGGIVQLPNGCPTPEERIAQECLENPYGDVDRVKPACIHLMQPISLDREALGAKMCQKMMPNCKAPYLDVDSGDCGCGSPVSPTPGSGTIVPGCALSIPNCVDGMPAKNGCGCQPYGSGGNACNKGGKDFYLTADPKNDLLVRVFPNKPYSTEHLLVARGGGVRIVTSAVKREQLLDATRLPVRAVLPGAGYDGTGQIRVSCTNATTGMRNLLVETFQLANLSTTGTNNLAINLSSSERNACFGTNPNNQTHFEFFVDSKPGQTVGFYDILGDFGNIKPACTPFPPRPTPGPRVLNSWPAQWTFSNGVTIPTIFNGTGPIPPLPPPDGTLPPPLCFFEGMLVPCQ